MTLTERKKAFIELGRFLSQFSLDSSRQKDNVAHNEPFYHQILELVQRSKSHNGWYTEEQVFFALQSWAEALTAENLDNWLSRYNVENIEPKTVGLVLAGNIPLVGFHDFLSVLVTGHRALVKTSSNDQQLLPFLAKYLIAIEPRFSDYITFTEGKLENFDAVIATGSNNTA